MIDEITTAAKSVGITAIITNSTEKIETQLNKITGIEELPIMLVSWDYETSVTFDESGFVNNPSTNIVLLLMTKADSKLKNELEEASESMGALFIEFAKTLNSNLKVLTKNGENALSSVNYKNVPRHGAGVHSGVLGKFTMLSTVTNC